MRGGGAGKAPGGEPAVTGVAAGGDWYDLVELDAAVKRRGFPEAEL